MLNKKDRIKRSFSPVYLAIFSGILLVILIINGVLEINRASKGFYSLLEREALVLLQHFEKNIQEALGSLQWMEAEPGKPLSLPPLSEFSFGLEESVAEYLLEVSHRVDRIDRETAQTLSDLESLIGQFQLSSIEIYAPDGTLLRGSPSAPPPMRTRSLLRDLIDKNRSVTLDLFGKPFSEGQWFSIVVRRKESPGIIALHLTGLQMKQLFRQFAIQRAISDIVLREGVLFISIHDARLQTLAHTDPASIGRKVEDPFLKNSLHLEQPLSRLTRPTQGEEVFEVIKPFSFKGTLMGLIRIGYSSKEVLVLLHQIRKNVVLSIFFFLVLGLSAITLIWVNQNRHLRKFKEMEDRIQLAERLSSLGHLAAGVAHEIRNPLNAIGMGIQRLRREFPPSEKTQKEEYLFFTDVILKETKRVNEIIEQFLTLARPFQLNLRPSSLPDLLNNLMTLFQEEALSHKIRLKADMDVPLPPIQMDREKLTQAFINIMKNGMQAMEHGGILLIETRATKDRVEVSWSDSGVGIPPDQMDKIFNYYYTTKERGVGLGLPIAHRIIEAHGGQVKVESREGVGTKVTVSLPIERKGAG